MNRILIFIFLVVIPYKNSFQFDFLKNNIFPLTILAGCTKLGYDQLLVLYNRYENRKEVKKILKKEDYELIVQYQGNIFELIDDAKCLRKSNNFLGELKNKITSINSSDLGEFPNRQDIENFINIFFYKNLIAICSFENHKEFESKKIDISNEKKITILKNFFLDRHNDFYDSLSSHTRKFGIFGDFYAEKNYIKRVFNDNSKNEILEKQAILAIQENKDPAVSFASQYTGLGKKYTYNDLKKLHGNVDIIGSQFTGYLQKIQQQFNGIKFLKSKGYTPNIAMPMAIFVGSPGIGKTFFTEVMFKKIIDEKYDESASLLITLSSNEIVDKWVGASEKQLCSFFESIKKLAKEAQKKNGIIFVCMNEIDSLGSNRDVHDVKEWSVKLTNTFLNCVDDLNKESLPICVFGTANSKNRIDDALKRPGRLELYDISLPEKNEKEKMIDMYEKKYCDAKFEKFLTEEEKEELLKLSTGAEISEKIKNIFWNKLDLYIKKNPHSSAENNVEKNSLINLIDNNEEGLINR